MRLAILVLNLELLEALAEHSHHLTLRNESMHAFVTQSQVMGVFGEGFEKFKVKHKNSKPHNAETEVQA